MCIPLFFTELSMFKCAKLMSLRQSAYKLFFRFRQQPTCRNIILNTPLKWCIMVHSLISM